MSVSETDFASNPSRLPKNVASEIAVSGASTDEFAARLDAICRRAERRLATLASDERFQTLQRGVANSFDSAPLEPDVSFVVRLGSATLTLEEVAALDVDSIVPLVAGGADGAVQIWANGRLCGRGTLLSARGKLAIKIEEIDPDAAFER